MRSAIERVSDFPSVPEGFNSYVSVTRCKSGLGRNSWYEVKYQLINEPRTGTIQYSIAWNGPKGIRLKEGVFQTMTAPVDGNDAAAMFEEYVYEDPEDFGVDREVSNARWDGS